MQNREYTLYCLAIAKLSVGLGQSELMPVEERIAPVKQEAPSSTRWSSSLFMQIIGNYKTYFMGFHEDFMRREGIYYYDTGLQLIGYEVLSHNPKLITNQEKDFINFKIMLIKLKLVNENPLVHHVNLMPSTLERYHVQVMDTISKLNLNDKVVIEIVEGEGVEVERVIKKLNKNGIRLAIDDFGTKHSNIDRLINTINYLDSIKIERVMWKNLPELVKALKEITDKKGIKLIAEKVETKKELNKLLDLGITYFQGRYFNGVDND
jgi:c-di-GMP-related signal transduction protein